MMSPFLGIRNQQRWSQPSEEPKEKGCLRVELAPWQAKCVQGTLRREQNMEEALQRKGVWMLEQGRCLDLCSILSHCFSMLVALGNDLRSFKNTDTWFYPEGFKLKSTFGVWPGHGDIQKLPRWLLYAAWAFLPGQLHYSPPPFTCGCFPREQSALLVASLVGAVALDMEVLWTVLSP